MQRTRNRIYNKLNCNNSTSIKNHNSWNSTGCSATAGLVLHPSSQFTPSPLLTCPSLRLPLPAILFLGLFLALHCFGRRPKIINLRFDMKMQVKEREREREREKRGGWGGVAGLAKTWIYRRRHKYKRSHRSNRSEQRPKTAKGSSENSRKMAKERVGGGWREKCARRRNTLNAHKYPLPLELQPFQSSEAVA